MSAPAPAKKPKSDASAAPVVVWQLLGYGPDDLETYVIPLWRFGDDRTLPDLVTFKRLVRNTEDDHEEQNTNEAVRWIEKSGVDAMSPFAATDMVAAFSKLLDDTGADVRRVHGAWQEFEGPIAALIVSATYE